MSNSPDVAIAAKLSRFPAEVREAYQRFLDTGDAAAVDLVVLAAVADFMPKKPEGAIKDEQKLIEDLGFDSLAVAELVFFLEDCFHVRVETAELFGLRTIGELRVFVAAKVANQGKVNDAVKS